jgi:hypothetical protein
MWASKTIAFLGREALLWELSGLFVSRVNAARPDQSTRCYRLPTSLSSFIFRSFANRGHSFARMALFEGTVRQGQQAIVHYNWDGWYNLKLSIEKAWKT